MFRFFTVLGVLLAIGCAHLSERSGEWRQLPLVSAGRIDTNWVHLGYGGWAVDGEALRTAPGENGLGLLVYRKERLGNCQIKVVFRAKNKDCNSGIYVRIDDGILNELQNPGAPLELNANGEPTDESLTKLMRSSEAEEGPWYAVHRGYEIQIDSSDIPESTPYNGTGSVYSLAKSTADYADTTKWTTFVITLAGERVFVEMNGRVVSSYDPTRDKAPERGVWYEPNRETKRPTAGYIGLQTHDADDIVWFREVSVRPLSPSELKRFENTGY